AKYGALIQGGAHLPAWNTIVPETIRQMQSSVWYAWLLRISLLNIELTPQSDNKAAVETISDELQVMIARFQGDEEHPDFVLTPFEASGPTQTQPLGNSTRRLTRVGTIALTLAVSVAVIYGAYFLSNWLAERTQWYALNPIIPAVAGAGIAAAGALYVLSRW